MSLLNFGQITSYLRPANCPIDVQAEARRLLEGLARLGNGETSVEVTVREIFSMADKLEIDVPDLSLLIEKLNEAGEPVCTFPFTTLPS